MANNNSVALSPEDLKQRTKPVEAWDAELASKGLRRALYTHTSHCINWIIQDKVIVDETGHEWGIWIWWDSAHADVYCTVHEQYYATLPKEAIRPAPVA